MIAKQIAEEVLRYDFVDGDAPSPRYIKPFFGKYKYFPLKPLPL